MNCIVFFKQTLKSYSEWKKFSIEYTDIEKPSKDDMLNIMEALEGLLLNFRKDIGHKNNGIESGDILSLFRNNWEERTK